MSMRVLSIRFDNITKILTQWSYLGVLVQLLINLTEGHWLLSTETRRKANDDCITCSTDFRSHKRVCF